MATATYIVNFPTASRRRLILPTAASPAAWVIASKTCGNVACQKPASGDYTYDLSISITLELSAYVFAAGGERTDNNTLITQVVGSNTLRTLDVPVN